jgi:HTH-type transcriptional regulator/antitoxin HigA
MMMDVRPLHTEADYEWALKEVERYFDNPPTPGTPEAGRFDVLAVLIEKYEDSHYDMPAADPIAVLHFAIDSMGRSQADLARIISGLILNPHSANFCTESYCVGAGSSDV